MLYYLLIMYLLIQWENPNLSVSQICSLMSFGTEGSWSTLSYETE